MSDPLVLAIDQGTTSTRALVFNARGEIIAKAQKELPLITPKSGWVEQDATQIWNDVVDVCKEALAQVDIDNVIGIGITNQRETTVIWDRVTGEPIYNAIVWQDRRTADFCETLKPFEGDIQARTGLLADPYFSATKIKWILDRTGVNDDDVLFGTIDSYLLWKLTGGDIHATDVSNAARTMVFNIHDMEWDDVQCDRIGVPMGMLPTVVENCAEFGMTNLFDKPLPILAMAGDQQSATFGQACFDKGMVKSTYGTGCFALMNTGDKPVKSQNKLLSTVAWKIDGQVTYALEGSIFVAGAAVQFLRDNLGLFDDARESEALATSVDDTDGVVFVPSFTGLGAPHWNPNARGAILGMSRGTTNAHITRAVLEAQAYQTRDLISAMNADVGTDVKTIRVDGGLVANDFVCQTIADQVNANIDRPVNQEATVWGAAAMAFYQAGVFKSFDDIANIHALEKQFTPQGDVQKNNRNYAMWQRAVECVSGF
jgi:glycerol kinase